MGFSFCVGSFFCALFLRQAKEPLRSLYANFANFLLLWAVGLWLLGGSVAIIKIIPAEWALGLLLFFIGLSFGLFHLISQRLSWGFLEWICDSYSIILSIMAIGYIFRLENISTPFLISSSLGWLLCVGVHYTLLFLRKDQMNLFFAAWNHRFGVWFIGALLNFQLFSSVKYYWDPNPTWLSSVFALILGCWIILILLYGRRWPVLEYQLDYQGYGIFPFALVAWFWTLNACLSLGDPAPLIYLPLLNPVEIAQGTCLLALFLWAKALKQPALQALPLPAVIKNNLGIALYGTLFICLTMMIARSVCYYTDIAFSPDGILFSKFFQTFISITWSGAAFLIMLFATRSNLHRLNALATLLLFLVAAKLFLVDIHLSQEIERICSFMWVGVIMLLSGYYMPTEGQSGLQEEVAGHGFLIKTGMPIDFK